jgi:hypothetical protein
LRYNFPADIESSKTDRGTFIIKKKMAKIGTEDVILAFGCLIRSSEMKDLEEWGEEEVGYRIRAIAVGLTLGVSKTSRTGATNMKLRIITTNWLCAIFQLCLSFIICIKNVTSFVFLSAANGSSVKKINFCCGKTFNLKNTQLFHECNCYFGTNTR